MELLSGGATASTYNIPGGDAVGTNITVDVIAHNLAGASSAQLCSAPAVVSNAPSWTDSLDPTTADTDDIQSDSHLIRWVDITLPAGNLTKLRVYLGQPIPSVWFGDSIKMALYDSSGNTLLTSGTLSSTSPNVWNVVSVSTITISGGSYKIAFVALGATDIGFRNKSGTGITHINFSGNYADFPTAALPSSDSDAINKDAVGALIG